MTKTVSLCNGNVGFVSFHETGCPDLAMNCNMVGELDWKTFDLGKFFCCRLASEVPRCPVVQASSTAE